MIRLLFLGAALGAAAAPLATFKERFNAVQEAPASSIPHEALHAKALEILRKRVIASDAADASVDALDKAHAEGAAK